MACFSLQWLEQLLIWLVFVIALVAIAKLIIPWLLSLFGTPPGGGIVVSILQIIVWALVAIAVIYFVFEMIGCVFGGGTGIGGAFPRLR